MKPSIGHKKKCILIVDDDPAIRMIISNAVTSCIMEQTSFEVVEAVDGIDALRKVGEHNPDLVLSDWNMPEMTGLHLLEELRGLGNKTPFAFITSKAGTEVVEQANACGAAFVLPKPFTTDELCVQLKSVLLKRPHNSDA